jgi:3-mercaptopyruvate sulfurtransferase SseA
MSPRAAWRLEALGFAEVNDYVDGKLDWLAAGLPTEGSNAERPGAGDVAAPTCRRAGSRNGSSGSANPSAPLDGTPAWS